jgi:DNA primase
MSPEIIQTQANLTRIISKHLKLEEGRRILKANCPFHADSSDSFMVSPAKNIFKCFGCGKEGGPIEFVMAIESKSYDEAVKSLALELGV